MKNIPGVYKIICTKNKKYYIGSSKNVKVRLKKHFYELDNGVHPNVILQNTYNKHGKDNFSYVILKYCTEYKKLEQHYIDKYYNSDYCMNISDSVDIHGSNTQRIPLLMLDFFGFIIREFNSGYEMMTYFQERAIVHRYINTNKIQKIGEVSCRLVTKKFYNENKETIFSWDNFIQPYKRTDSPKKLMVRFENKNKDIILFKGINKACDYFQCTPNKLFPHNIGKKISRFFRGGKVKAVYIDNLLMDELLEKSDLTDSLILEDDNLWVFEPTLF